jgi:hypothetical protein
VRERVTRNDYVLKTLDAPPKQLRDDATIAQGSQRRRIKA